MTNHTIPTVRIKVIGVGGAGGNAVTRISNQKNIDLELLAINTDTQALAEMENFPTFAIGPVRTLGMGSGGDPKIGRQAIKESQTQISELLMDTDMVFITAGMGGGTGTGAAPMVAEIAKKHGALTVAIVTRPFSFEGKSRRITADIGIEALQKKVDTLIVIENDRLIDAVKGDTTLNQAFEIADEVLGQGVKGITEIINTPGLINVDFADIKSLMEKGGKTFMGMGKAKGKDAAKEAVRAALSSPMFDSPIESCSGILLNIKSCEKLSMDQIHEITDFIKNRTSQEIHIVFGIANDQTKNKHVVVTIIATGLGSNRDKTQDQSTSSNTHKDDINHELMTSSVKYINEVSKKDPIPRTAAIVQ